MGTEPFSTWTMNTSDLGEGAPFLNTVPSFIRFFRADDPFDKTAMFPLLGPKQWFVGRIPEGPPATEQQGCIGSRGDGLMSGRHAALSFLGGRWSLADAGSKNGTFVNGTRLEAPHMLRDGDVVECGHTFFVYRDVPVSQRPFGILSTAVDRPPLYYQIARIYPYVATDLSIHLCGETGTGKEVVAKAIHNFSDRKSSEFVAINCAAIPEALFESELFGHVKGAFSGATERKLGKVLAAEGGTLLLDEIGELPPSLQAKLLRVLETKEITPVGATKPIRVDFRLVSATLRNLAEMESFRSDLRARLGHVVAVPPLREHIEEFGPLVRSFLTELMTKHRQASVAVPRVSFTLAASRALLGYRWPLNVRELKQCIEAAAIAALDEKEKGRCIIDLRHLPSAISTATTSCSALKQPEPVGPPLEPAPLDASVPRELPPAEVVTPGRWSPRPSENELRAALMWADGHRVRTAEFFGVSERTLYRWLKELHIDDF